MIYFASGGFQELQCSADQLVMSTTQVVHFLDQPSGSRQHPSFIVTTADDYVCIDRFDAKLEEAEAKRCWRGRASLQQAILLRVGTSLPGSRLRP